MRVVRVTVVRVKKVGRVVRVIRRGKSKTKWRGGEGRGGEILILLLGKPKKNNKRWERQENL